MNTKWRILLHSMNFKRDFGIMYILARLLEHLGCECFIGNNNNYVSRRVKQWKPHAIFFGTITRTKVLRENYPNAKLFFSVFETGGLNAKSQELSIIQDEFLFNALSKVFLSNKSAKGTIVEIVQQAGVNHFLYNREHLIEEKYDLAGAPRRDLAIFSKSNSIPQGGKKIRIGFVGNFSYINNNNIGANILNSILDSMDPDEIVFQIRLLETYMNIVNELGCDKYEYSIRPYVIEPKEQYFTEFVNKNNITIDSSLDFATWLNKQDLIIASTSSTILQIYMLNKSYLNLDLLNGRKLRPGYFFKVMDTILRKNAPKNDKELYEMIKNYNNFKLSDPELNNMLDLFFGSSMKHSILLHIACGIVTTLRKDASPEGGRISLGLLVSADHLRNRFGELLVNLKGPKKVKHDYSKFNLKEILPKAIEELDPIVENILKGPENTEILKLNGFHV